ncbi:MAG: methyltransferase domain-containing protein [Thermomonas sp.]
MDPLKLMRYALAGWLPGGRRRCAMCGHSVWRFMPYRDGARGVPPLMAALDGIGSDVEHFECPRCGAHDRERHLLLYMRASGIFDRIRGARVLHFAPERRLSPRIAAALPAEYVRCDLYPSGPDVRKIDIEAMPFADGAFDLAIANHVLEHVDDERKALGEVARVLAPGGFAILQTPYSAMLHGTWRDPGIDTPEARLQAYGQEDHVRLFGRDIFERFAATGFESHVRAHADLLGDVDPDKAGVNPREPFFLFRKPA